MSQIHEYEILYLVIDFYYGKVEPNDNKEEVIQKIVSKVDIPYGFNPNSSPIREYIKFEFVCNLPHLLRHFGNPPILLAGHRIHL